MRAASIKHIFTLILTSFFVHVSNSDIVTLIFTAVLILILATLARINAIVILLQL
jgi:hypothetical protein